METKKDLRKIHISLDKEAYKVLKQKSSYSGLSMNAYLKKIALEVNITTYTIVVHDLSAAISDLDMITFRAGLYQDLVARKGGSISRIEEGDSNDMIRLFYRLRDYLAGYCQKFVDGRNEKLAAESDKIQRLIDESVHSTYRDQNTEYEERRNNSMIVRMTQAEYEQFNKNMEVSKLFEDDVSKYLRNLIMSKYYIWLRYDIEDVNTVNANIYEATRYGKNFILMLYRQGDTQKARELEGLYNEVVHHQIELYKMVCNDRLALFRRFNRKIHEAGSDPMTNMRLKKERGLWQSQE